MFAWEFDDLLVKVKDPGPQGENDRFPRAMYFLQAARNAGSIPEKIAFYCTSFEALVSTDSMELSHKVSERVAALLGDGGDGGNNPTIIYSEIKGAYDTRSKLVHGDKLRKAHETYVEQSVKCDVILRKLLFQFATDKALKSQMEQSPAKINDYFLRRLFPQSNCPVR